MRSSFEKAEHIKELSDTLNNERADADDRHDASMMLNRLTDDRDLLIELSQYIVSLKEQLNELF